jgi:hypothetical protein
VKRNPGKEEKVEGRPSDFEGKSENFISDGTD